MPKRHVLCFKADLRPEWRDQDRKHEAYKRKHRVNLCDSLTSSTWIRFSVHTAGDWGRYRGFIACPSKFLWRFRSQANLWIFSEGQNLIIEYRRSDDPRGVSVAGAELLGANFDLIVAVGPEVALRAVIDADRPIPIVVQAINYDPIARGFVASLARPGGNITGLFYQQAELAAKKVELLTQAIPERKNLGVLWDTLVTEEFEAAQRAAKPLGLELHAVKLEHPPYNFPAALQAIARAGAQMLLVLSSPLFALHRHEVANLAIEHRLPAMFIFKSYVQAGGLMSYGVDQFAMYRRTAGHVAKILKGAKPADLPVEQPMKFELVINLKTAKALGVTLPQSLLVAADEVIE